MTVKGIVHRPFMAGQRALCSWPAMHTLAPFAQAPSCAQETEWIAAAVACEAGALKRWAGETGSQCRPGAFVQLGGTARRGEYTILFGAHGLSGGRPCCPGRPFQHLPIQGDEPP